MRISVRKIFAFAAGALAGAIFWGSETRYELFNRASLESLTAGESALAKRVFGRDTDPAPVRKIFSPDPHDKGYAAQVFHGRFIEFYGYGNHSADYSTDPRAENLALFIHELTHVWQRQTGMRQTNGTCPEGFPEHYKYFIGSDDRFRDFCNEKQGAIMQDYARRFLHREESGTVHMQNTNGAAENDRLLKAIVEDRFPGARGMRIALEATRRRERSSPPMPLIRPMPVPRDPPPFVLPPFGR